MTQDPREVVASYITDMMALEEHLHTACAGQLADGSRGRFGSLLREITSTSEEHQRALRELAERREGTGQGIAEAVKKAAASVLGIGAAAIDFVRSEKLPKNLRDDYAAVSLATVGYLMLHTTAVSLDDVEVADIAYAHLRDYATVTMQLFNAIPDAIIDFLSTEGFAIDADVSARVGDAVQAISNQGATRDA